MWATTERRTAPVAALPRIAPGSTSRAGGEAISTLKTPSAPVRRNFGEVVVTRHVWDVSGDQIGAYVGGALVAIGLGEPLEEQVGAQVVLLRADGLQDERGEQGADLGAALQRQPPRAGGEEAGAEAVTTPVGS